jgi:phosphohistidine phosphatase SixA
MILVRHARADYIPDEQRPLSIKGQADAESVEDGNFIR